MTQQIRRVATGMLVLFALLFVNLNVIQLVRGEDLATHTANRRLLEREYEIERGPILVDDVAVVQSVETTDELKYLRQYLEPELYAHVTGFYSFVSGRSALEKSLNEELNGTPTDAIAENLTALLIGRDPAGNKVRLTIDPAVQAAARTALGDRTGAVVALDPSTGAVLAHYSNPTYDPNALSSHDAADIQESWRNLLADPERPLIDRVTRETFPPGSTFKLVVAAAALERGLQPTSAIDNDASYTPPQTSVPIQNFSPGRCGDGGETISLADAMRVSCNTAFARLGVRLTADALRETAVAFGFEREMPYELPVAPSRFSAPQEEGEEIDAPATAQSAIGQRDVRITPMHAAVLVSAIVNEGELLRPHVVADVLDPAGRPLRGPNIGPWQDEDNPSQAVSPRTADLLRQMMIDVVERGTGQRAQIPGVEVGGKTGTAEDPNADSPTAWFIGFAEDDVVVAVVLPDAGGDGGGAAAAPVARAVMEAALS